MTKKLIMIAASIVLLISGSVAALMFSPLGASLGLVQHPPMTDAHDETHDGVARDGMKPVRQLFGYQDRIAKGDQTAIASQDESIERIANDFEGFTPADWKDRKNVQAVMAYVLSGGRTEAVESFLDSKPAAEQEILAKGVLSFARRRPKTALKQIGDLEMAALDKPLVGVFALALASLHAAANAERGLELFEEARLHAPSTAVEEAALRRVVPLLMKEGQLARATTLISRYARIFRNSPFAPRFYSDLAHGLMGLPDKFDRTQWVSALDDAMKGLAEQTKAPLFLKIARTALIAGRTDVAKAAADALLAVPSEDSAHRRKAELYAAAAIAVSEDAENAISALEAIDASSLDEDDQAIRTAAGQIARAVAAAAPRAQSEVVNKPAETEAAGNAGGEEVLAVVVQADKAIEQADRLISTIK